MLQLNRQVFRHKIRWMFPYHWNGKIPFTTKQFQWIGASCRKSAYPSIHIQFFYMKLENLMYNDIWYNRYSCHFWTMACNTFLLNSQSSVSFPQGHNQLLYMRHLKYDGIDFRSCSLQWCCFGCSGLGAYDGRITNTFLTNITEIYIRITNEFYFIMIWGAYLNIINNQNGTVTHCTSYFRRLLWLKIGWMGHNKTFLSCKFAVVYIDFGWEEEEVVCPYILERGFQR